LLNGYLPCLPKLTCHPNIFHGFYRKHDLEDAWKEFLQLSRDRPDLNGDAVIKNAFILFLLHIFHSRPDEFPVQFTRFHTGFSREIYQPLSLEDLKNDLMDLGYTADDLENFF
jgi:hypothetical protein